MITLKELVERDKRPVSVTVYMISYNHEKYLDKAIQGVLMQKTNFPVNIVIHDDASTDRSGEIIRRYASENDNIFAKIEETNFYQNGKDFFPLMLPYLTGKYIAYCECDDFWIDENKLQKQIDYLENNSDCLAVYSNSLPVNKYGNYDETRRILRKTGEGDYPSYKATDLVHQLATLVHRNIYSFMTEEEINCFSKCKACGDQKLFSVLLHTRGGGRVHYFKEELAAYRYVTDEGDSASARATRLSKFENYKSSFINTIALYDMINTLFGKKYDRKFFYLLWTELRLRIECHRSIAADIGYTSFFKDIPFYIYCIFPFYALKRSSDKVTRVLLKAWRTRYQQ